MQQIWNCHVTSQSILTSLQSTGHVLCGAELAFIQHHVSFPENDRVGVGCMQDPGTKRKAAPKRKVAIDSDSDDDFVIAIDDGESDDAQG